VARSESHGRCAAVGKIAVQVVTTVRTGVGGCCEGEEGKLVVPLDHDTVRIRVRGAAHVEAAGDPQRRWLATGMERR
jgi:hypothetical protein